MELVMAPKASDSAEMAAARQLHDELLPKMPDGTHESSGCQFCTTNEQAAEGVQVPGESESTSKTVVDLEDPAILAVVRDRVERETAELRTRAESAEKERDEAKAKLDVTEAEKSAAETARDEAQAKVTEMETAAANEKAASERKDARVTALREAAPGMKDDFLTEDRTKRIAEMADEAFEDYKGEMAAAFAGVKPAASTTTTSTKGADGPPRETAMSTSTAGGSTTDDVPASKQWIGGVSAFGGAR
jgi:hypothetical protein